MTTGNTPAQSPQGVALRHRLECLVDWLRLELEKNQLDAESAYDHADKLLGIVSEMRWLDPAALQRPGEHINAGALQ